MGNIQPDVTLKQIPSTHYMFVLVFEFKNKLIIFYVYLPGLGI